ncbi:MAG: hypothetical protein JO150_05570, partial [Acidobacteriaceae bacterium]|nr:hypothetical protein [Acidobacteriaceae bacterium]
MFGSRLQIVFGLGLAVAGFSTFAKAQDQTFKDAFALYQAGSISQARELLLTALEKTPSALDYSLLGSIEFEQKQFDSAEQH